MGIEPTPYADSIKQLGGEINFNMEFAKLQNIISASGERGIQPEQPK